MSGLGTLALMAGLLGVAAPGEWDVGFGKADATPTGPIRLSGYSSRDKPSEGVESKLGVRAMAMRAPDGPLFVIASVETIGLPGPLTVRVMKRMGPKHGLSRERMVLCSTHSHTAPQLAGGIKNIFRQPPTPDEAATIDAYTKRLEDAIVEAIDRAAADLAPATISVGEAKAGFAAHRRVIKDGKWVGFGVNSAVPVDRSVPFLRVTGKDGRVRGLVINYACHATTLTPEFNRVCGDWPGFAMDELERRHPGAVALTVIGCGGDINPEPRGKLEHSRAHGLEIADAVDRVNQTVPVTSPPTGKFGYAGLPPERPSTSDLTKQLVHTDIHVRRNAADLLAVATRMGRLPETYPCPIHVWRFGDALTMVFLGGEVVTDYALRLRRELPAKNLWVTAYSDDVFGYVASERMRAERGYEFDYSAIYYGLPGPWLPGTEDLLIRRVREVSQSSDAQEALAPKDAHRSFRVREGLEIELVAAEPLTVDPIGFDFGPDGRLWVVEMRDYPSGMDGKGKPGGRIRVLEDRDRDGVFDHATTFLDGLPFPTGVACFRKGALITAAPNLLYAVDEDGDGKADKTEVLFQGFARANPQHRVAGFAYGLDGQFYISGEGLGSIVSKKTGQRTMVSGRDARINPDNGTLDPVNGQTQFARGRDDWGQWFGGNNSIPIWHYLLPDRYSRRNPHVAAASSWVTMMDPVYNPPVFPASRTVDRFNDLHTANRFTSACGPAFYRSNLFGASFERSAFICEPVHNLIHRVVVGAEGPRFKASRAPDEQSSEFLASTDPWSRPVRVATGPDGAVWFADMYRQVIEHPQWIPEAWQARLDLRAGEDKGRIYRVYPKGRRPGPLPTLANAAPGEWVKALESPHGPLRDMAQRLLLERGKPDIAPALEALLSHPRPETRVQALWTLSGLKALTPKSIELALRDSHPGVRRNAMELAEPYLDANASLGESIARASEAGDGALPFQAALSLGEWNDAKAGVALGNLAVRTLDDPWMRAAILSSSAKQPEAVLTAVLAKGSETKARSELIERLVATTAAVRGTEGLSRLLGEILPDADGAAEAWRFAALAGLLDALGRRNQSLEPAVAKSFKNRIGRILSQSRAMAAGEEPALSDRTAAIRLLGRGLDASEGDFELLAGLLNPRNAIELRSAAIAALAQSRSEKTPSILFASWNSLSPASRNEALDVLLSRPEWTQALIQAAAMKKISPTDVDTARRERLLAHPRPEIRQESAKLFAVAGSESRRQAMDAYRDVLTMEGNPIRGSAVFARTCAACHQFRARGVELGPSLVSLKDKSNEVLLTAVLDPNRAVESRYLSYTASTVDGRVLSGLVVEETSTSVTLARPDGGRDVLPRVDIEAFVSSGKSFMPEGLESEIPPSGMADLFAFLRSATRPGGPGDAAAREAAIRQCLDAGVDIAIAPPSDEREVETWMGQRRVFRRGPGGQNTIAWRTPPSALIPLGAKRLIRFPIVMGGVTAKGGSFTLYLGGRPLATINGSGDDASWAGADGQAKVVFLSMERSADQASGLLEVEFPTDLSPAGQPLDWSLRAEDPDGVRWIGLIPVKP